MIRVLLVDDQDVIREGMRSLIANDAELTVVGECTDGDEVLQQIPRCRPDVVVMDIRMKRTDGATATVAIGRPTARPCWCSPPSTMTTPSPQHSEPVPQDSC